MFTQIPNMNNNSLAMKPYGLPVFPGQYGEPCHLLPPAGLVFPGPPPLHRPLQLAAQQQPQQPVVLTNKLKAQPTLISISSARDHHKFMPY
jgi:hypothetical protein